MRLLASALSRKAYARATAARSTLLESIGEGEFALARTNACSASARAGSILWSASSISDRRIRNADRWPPILPSLLSFSSAVQTSASAIENFVETEFRFLVSGRASYSKNDHMVALLFSLPYTNLSPLKTLLGFAASAWRTAQVGAAETDDGSVKPTSSPNESCRPIGLTMLRMPQKSSIIQAFASVLSDQMTMR